MRLWAQVIKELLIYLRDPDVRISLVVPPLLQLFVLSGAATLEVRTVDIAVVDDDLGRASHEFVQRVAASYFVRNVISAPNPDAVMHLIDERKVIYGVLGATVFFFIGLMYLTLWSTEPLSFIHLK